jgi:hypothetical protein
MTHTLAIVERLPGHTEVMGGFAALAIELGYDVHLLFNRNDPFQRVGYLDILVHGLRSTPITFMTGPTSTIRAFISTRFF